jgi:hypothetical protein
VVTLDQEGKATFNLLQNFGSAGNPVYYVFDLLVFAGKDVMLWCPLQSDDHLELVDRFGTIVSKQVNGVKLKQRPIYASNVCFNVQRNVAEL